MIRSLRIIGLCLLVVVFSQCDNKSAPEGATLENTYWRLAEFNGIPLTVAEGKKEVYIQMKTEGEQKQLTGFSGCNSIGGSFTSGEHNAIKFNAISTRMACAEGMDVENFLQYALSTAEKYVITGKSLELYKEEMLLAKFEEAAPPLAK